MEMELDRISPARTFDRPLLGAHKKIQNLKRKEKKPHLDRRLRYYRRGNTENPFRRNLVTLLSLFSFRYFPQTSSNCSLSATVKPVV